MADHLEDPLAKRDRDVVRVQRSLGRKEPVATLVVLADDGRTMIGTVEVLLYLHLDERSLLLHDDHHLQPRDELADVLHVERPGTGDLEQPHADLVGAGFIDADVLERLAHVEIALADGDDADPGVRAAGIDDAVEPVGADERRRRPSLVFVQPRLLAHLVQFVADVEPARRHLEIGQDDVEPVERNIDRCRRFDVVLDAFHRRPCAGEARHGEAVEAVVDDLLHAGRIEDRDHRVDEMEFGRVRVRGRFGGVVVAHQRQHAAIS